ncbi:MAG: hypothetical protein FK732_01695 [Asgard group archaeon]|nr:hypothetical protein [Asgard group archaeon]
MKLRLMPILLMLVGVAGVVLYATTPVIMTKVHYVREGFGTDFVQTFKFRFGGNGEVTSIGELAGSPIDTSYPIDKDGWDYYWIDLDPYNDVVIYLSFVGLGVAFLGIFFSIFGYSDGLRIAGALLGIIGGGLGIAGGFMLYNYNTTFQADCEIYAQVNAGFLFSTYTITYGTFGPGWLAPVISSGLIAIGSVFLLLIKPK